jgi:peptidoglycan/xylan/chitin deacetylase (PgdA/CDA1 family)|tara:strand:+ start:53456 stop:54388 length:933 start_codon:yes stop_codon:yes gene_type:complete
MAKDAIYSALRASGLFKLSNHLTRNGLRILCYHGLWETPGPGYGDRLFMPVAQFEARMQYLARSGRPVLSLDDAVRRLGAGTLPRGATVITIDDGCASTVRMAEILAQYRLPSTVYVTTWYIDNPAPIIQVAADYISSVSGQPVPADLMSLPRNQREAALLRFGKGADVPGDWHGLRQFHLMTPDELARVAALGMDIQLHTHRHNMEDLPSELDDNANALARLGIENSRLTHFCYPSGNHQIEHFDVLQERGIRSATTCVAGLNFRNTPRLALKRFLDGRSVSDAEFDAYLTGFQAIADGARERISSIRA